MTYYLAFMYKVGIYYPALMYEVGTMVPVDYYYASIDTIIFVILSSSKYKTFSI